jgi:hypothetical protein
MYNRLDKRKKELKGQVIEGRKVSVGLVESQRVSFNSTPVLKFVFLFSSHGQTKVVLLHGDYEKQD